MRCLKVGYCKKPRNSCFLFFCFLFIFIAGCENEPGNTKEKKEVEQNEQNSKALIKPLALTDDEYMFESSYGWIDDDTIIYAAQKDQTYYLFSYHIATQKKKKLYSTKEIIAEASVSPNKKYILLYSAGQSSKATIQILSTQGSELYSVSIPSSEVSFSWNPFSEEVVLINSFYEDWSYKSFIINFNKQTLEEVSLPKPFAQWNSKDELLYLQWDEESPQLTAPLERYELLTGKTTNLYKDVITFQADKKVLLTVHEYLGSKKALKYSFHDWKGNVLHSLKSPVIGSYSDWMIPSFYMNEKTNTFITFLPYESSVVDQYEKGFQLISFNWKTGKRRIIKENMESAPISCSPNGKRCLYGNTLEKLIEI